MYFSERRKQGLGSLRRGYFSGGGIAPMLLGNAINWGLGKGMDYLTKSPEQRKKEAWEKTKARLGIIDLVDQSTDNNNNGTTTSSGWKGALGGGIMNLLATAMLGPLMGPIALTVGRGLMNKSKGLGFTGGDGRSGIGPQKTYGITNIENIKDMKLPDDSGSAAGDPSLTYDYGITQGIDSSDSGAVADAIDDSTPDDFGQSEGMVDGWED